MEQRPDNIKISDPILIVEDNIRNQQLFQGLCDEMNLEWEVAENGQVALDKINEKQYYIYNRFDDAGHVWPHNDTFVKTKTSRSYYFSGNWLR